jgi:hypothetical protein
LQQNEIRPGPKRNDRAVDVDMDGLIASGTLFTSSNSDEVARKSQPKAAPRRRASNWQLCASGYAFMNPRASAV